MRCLRILMYGYLFLLLLLTSQSPRYSLPECIIVMQSMCARWRNAFTSPKIQKKIYIYSQSTQITNEKQPFRASIRVLSRAADDDHKLYVPADIYHSGYDRCQPAHSQYEYVLQLQNHHHSVCSTFRLLSAQIEDAENEKNINKSTMALRASSNWLEAADNAQARRKCLWPFFASISSSHSALSTAKWNSWCFH